MEKIEVATKYTLTMDRADPNAGGNHRKNMVRTVERSLRNLGSDYIDLLWLKEELRGRGYGHRLLMLAEDEARQRGATHAYMDTFSFQAPDFYQRHGYQVFGELKDFPHGHQRYFLTKQL
ncbi:MAG: GNAT family N-acetyltransferase [Chloroflexi bacterium]|nr:GNAT family N-acetyltransferase [Chloroflexota bacterium]